MAKKNFKKTTKSKEGHIELLGTIVDKAPGGKFIIELSDNKDVKVTATPCGKMRVNKITLVIGDIVRVEVSPYDVTNGRITRRI